MGGSAEQTHSAGLEVGVSLFKTRAGPINFNLGVGADTGIGIRDDSFTLKAVGCGFTVGRKWEISVYGTSFGIDFGTFF